MRHVGSLVLSAVLGLLVWALLGFGTPELGFDEPVLSSVVGLVLLCLAGVLYAVLVLAPLSPVGPVLLGLTYLGVSLWAGVDTVSYGRTIDGVNDLLRTERFDPPLQLLLVLAWPLLGTVVSPRRWRSPARAAGYPGARPAAPYAPAYPGHPPGAPAPGWAPPAPPPEWAPPVTPPGGTGAAQLTQTSQFPAVVAPETGLPGPTPPWAPPGGPVGPAPEDDEATTVIRRNDADPAAEAEATTVIHRPTPTDGDTTTVIHRPAPTDGDTTTVIHGAAPDAATESDTTTVIDRPAPTGDPDGEATTVIRPNDAEPLAEPPAEADTTTVIHRPTPEAPGGPAEEPTDLLPDTTRPIPPAAAPGTEGAADPHR